MIERRSLVADENFQIREISISGRHHDEDPASPHSPVLMPSSILDRVQRECSCGLHAALAPRSSHGATCGGSLARTSRKLRRPGRTNGAVRTRRLPHAPGRAGQHRPISSRCTFAGGVRRVSLAQTRGGARRFLYCSTNCRPSGQRSASPLRPARNRSGILVYVEPVWRVSDVHESAFGPRR